MKIALNALLMSQSATYRAAGISQYIYELLVHLRRRPPELEYEAFVAAEPEDHSLSATPNFRCVAVGSRLSRPSLRILWEQLVQPLQTMHQGASLTHALGYALPLAWRGRSVLTICDLSFLRFPEMFNRSNAIYLGTMARISARRASHVITISESTRQDVIQLLGVPPERVTTTYCGVASRFQPAHPAALRSFRERTGLPEAFLLYLGTIEPRKNVSGLLRAYAQYRAETTGALPLVLAGGRGWKDQEAFDLVESLGLAQDVSFPGFVPSEDLPLWYSAATAFVYPSRYEGFGLPVAEAMACGTPVVTSNASSLPEVVGDAGLTVKADDTEALSKALQLVTTDESLRRTLSLAGQSRVTRFRWDRMAEETVAIYQRMLSSPADTE